MSNRNWKHPPQSIQGAMQACLDHALIKHRLKLERIAADMGLANAWNLYKWVESGRIPAVLIRPFELACRCNYVTSYLAHAAHRLIIDIPTGRMPTSCDLPAVQAATHDAMGALINFAAGKAKAEEVMTAVTTAMEQLAFHRENAARATQPQLELDQPE